MSKVKLVPTEGNTRSCVECYFFEHITKECRAPAFRWDDCGLQNRIGVYHIFKLENEEDE